MESGGILILSGPSGSGKSTLCKYLQENIPNIYFSISTTTRSPREGEKNGKHYYFVSEEEFLKDIEESRFLEWAEVHGNYYGTSLAPIQEALNLEKLIVFDVDVQGHRSIKNYYPEAYSVFVTTKNQQVLRDRLNFRQTDSDETIRLRLMHAYNEMKHIEEFDYLIVNDEIKAAKEAILHIAKSLPYKQNVKNSACLCKKWLENLP
ncbi:guanylate kinase [Helicobacter sp. 12S02232-10]|uniref:guanylate kinase n=1 Tax=Helicobacter sp. 12S02232-10 TaxID=1476197 RepID=UPI000BA5FA2E|nr:guanylate kinase [Helicobacter sp. 12S02232-10]PAF47183.1 guanylate kinase [Helicobacter sp. 12S02232-10]